MIDFPPWVQTALTLAAVALVIAFNVGRVLVERDPASIWGQRLMFIGIGVNLIRRSVVYRVLPLPPLARRFLDSFSDSDQPPPPGVTVTRSVAISTAADVTPITGGR